MIMLQASVKVIAYESIILSFFYLEPICPLFLVQKNVFSNQNKGHLGSRYAYSMYINYVGI